VSALVYLVWVVKVARLPLAVGEVHLRAVDLWLSIGKPSAIGEIRNVAHIDISDRGRDHQFQTPLLDSWIVVGVLNKKPGVTFTVGPNPRDGWPSAFVDDAAEPCGVGAIHGGHVFDNELRGGVTIVDSIAATKEGRERVARLLIELDATLQFTAQNVIHLSVAHQR
jgi:hypothetical protein